MDKKIETLEENLDFSDSLLQTAFLKIGLKDQIILAIAFDLFRKFYFPVNFAFYNACENLDPKHFRQRLQLALTRLKNVTKLSVKNGDPFTFFKVRLELLFYTFSNLYHAQQEGSNVFTLVEIYLEFCGTTLPNQNTLRLFLNEISSLVDLSEQESEALTAVLEDFTPELNYQLPKSKEILEKLSGWKNTRFSELLSKIIEALTNPNYSDKDNGNPEHETLLSKQAKMLANLSSFKDFLMCLSPEEKSLALALVRLKTQNQEVTISSILEETGWPANESTPSKIAYIRKSIEEKIKQLADGEIIVVYENGLLVPSHSPRVALFIILSRYSDTFRILMSKISLQIDAQILGYILEHNLYMEGKIVVINSNAAISARSNNGHRETNINYVNRSINKLTTFCRKLIFTQLFFKYRVWLCHSFFSALSQHDSLLYPFLNLPNTTQNPLRRNPEEMQSFQAIIEILLKLKPEQINLLLRAMIASMKDVDKTDQILLDWVSNILE